MTFAEMLEQAIALLQQRGRLTYKTLQLQFRLDTVQLEALKDELIYGQRLAFDEEDRVLVWRNPPISPFVSTVPHSPVPAPALLTSAPASLGRQLLTTERILAGERKQVTVLFADLEGSMALLANRDPEEARQLLDPVLACMMEAVRSYEGTVNQVLGDGIMALFGAPYAHEDHAARACYAALAMQAALRRHAADVCRTHGVSIQIRVGLNSGEVVVRTIRNDVHVDYSAVGQTTHLAARMEQLATPGRIALTAATLRLVEGVVEVTPLGAVSIKGLAEPVEAFELRGATPGHRRVQVTATHESTRFVGRQTELMTLQQALERAGTGQGQSVAIVGEAGIGKSRLVHEFRYSPCTEGWRVLESVALPYGKAIPYRSLLDLLKQYVRLDDRDDAQTIDTMVRRQILTLDEGLRDIIPALLWLLEALPSENPFLHLDPPQRYQRICHAFTQLFLRESLSQPLILLFEDIHWLDAATKTVLSSLMDYLPTARLLLLVSCRPDYQPGWSHKASYIQLRLAPLRPGNAEVLLQALMGRNPSLAALKQALIARTAGNPFFLEESVRSLVETQVLVGRPGDYNIAKTVASLPVPATVQAVLASRMDRLSPATKELLQTAAVIGHEVPRSLLCAMTELAEAALQGCLRQLRTTEFLYETRLFPEPVYAFQHALTHEVAYGMLLHEQRRALHARVVVALEALPGERTAEQVAHLAQHSLRGAVWNKALTYCRQAGEQALARSAHHEAVQYFEAALQALAHLPGQRQRYEQAIDLRLALRSALFPLGDEARILAYLREAAALAEALHDSRRLGQVTRFLSHDFNTRGAHTQAIATGRHALALAIASGDSVLYALVYRYLGAAFMAQGDYRRAVDCFGQTVQYLDGVRRRERFGQVFLPAVLCRAYLATCHAELGTFAEGRAFGDEGLRIAQEADHPSSLMCAYRGSGLLALRQGDLARAVPFLERAVGICQDTKLPAFFPVMAAALGTAYTLGGRADDAIPLLTRALAQCAITARADIEILCRLSLGEAQAFVGHLEEARILAERTLTLARKYGERSHQAYALHLLGSIAIRQNPAEYALAETCTHQALDLANALSMRPLVAHCHCSLGIVYGQQGRLEKARATLSTAIAFYRTMAMTFWLPQAEALLLLAEG